MHTGDAHDDGHDRPAGRRMSRRATAGWIVLAIVVGVAAYTAGVVVRDGMPRCEVGVEC
jgi:hypothetical protein